MTEFLDMGGYAAYIWPAYGLALVVMVGLLLVSLKELRDHEATLKALESMRPNRRERRAARADTDAVSDTAPSATGKALGNGG